MKTKNLMTAFALSAMFAACSQDAELNETLAKNDFSNVPMVEADFTVSTGVDSRLATKYGWELNDIVGFVWNGLANDGKAYANNPLYCTNATTTKFEGAANYFVGDYFSYVPYEDELMGIGYVPFTIKGQELSTNLADYAKYKIMISPSLTTLSDVKEDIEAGNALEAGRKKNYPLYLSELSNTAKIVLNFENTEALAGLKVTKVTLNPKSSTDFNLMPLSFDFTSAGYQNVTVEDWNGLPTSDFYTQLGDITNKIGALELSSEEGVAVTGDVLTTYAVVLPVKETAKLASLEVIVETNYGTIVANDVKVIAKGKTEADAAAVSSTTELFTKFGVTGTVVAALDADEITMGNKAEVKSQAELNEVLNKLVAIEETGVFNIVLNNATASNPLKPFVLTDFIMPEGLKAQYIALSTGDKAAGIEFAGNTVVNYPLALGANAVVTGSMTVEYIKDENWTLTNYIAGIGLTIDNGAVLNNKGVIAGSLAVSTVAATTGNDAKVAGKYVSAGEKSKLASSLTNAGEAQWIAGIAPVVVSGGNHVYAEVTNYRNMKEAATAGVVLVRIMDSWYFENANTDVVVNGIKEIECYGNNITFGVAYNSVNGKTKVSFPDLTVIDVMEGASLSIYSSEYYTADGSNVFEWNTAGATINVEGSLNLSDIELTNTANVKNYGNTNVYNVSGTVNKVVNEGSWTSKEVK